MLLARAVVAEELVMAPDVTVVAFVRVAVTALLPLPAPATVFVAEAG